MEITAEIITNMVVEMENDNVTLSEQFESIITTMESNISSDLIQFNLMEKEEETLLNHIMEAINQSSKIFETSLAREKEYKEIMASLLKDLLQK